MLRSSNHICPINRACWSTQIAVARNFAAIGAKAESALDSSANAANAKWFMTKAPMQHVRTPLADLP